MQINKYPSVKAMVDERLSCGDWPQAQSDGDYLAMVLDEISVQEDVCGIDPNSYDDLELLDHLIGVAQHLLDCGVEASPLPWEVEND